MPSVPICYGATHCHRLIFLDEMETNANKGGFDILHVLDPPANVIFLGDLARVSVNVEEW